MDRLILVINTGSTSTKAALYKGDEILFMESIKHPENELEKYAGINEQKEYREEKIIGLLENKGISIKDISAVSARGGLLRPLDGGTYRVNDKMIEDLLEGKRGMHASHLAAQIGYSIADSANSECYIVDPVSVDEYSPLARYSGHSEFERVSLTHALNMKAVAKRFASENHLDYTTVNLIVIHLGSGISVSIHDHGIMSDAVNPMEEGGFSPDRSGGLPVVQVVKYVLENKIDFKSFHKMVFGNGGIKSYLGTSDFMNVEQMCKNGDKKAAEVVEAMAYQAAKEAGALSTVVNGKVDAILITGGMAHAEFLTNLISKRIEFIAPIHLYPGEDEIEALYEGAARVLSGREEARIY